MENDEESQQAEGEGGEPKRPAKSSGRLFLIIGAVIATGGSAAAGAVLGPSLAKARAPVASAPVAVASSEHGGGEEGELASLDPIIVDIREVNGDAHHLKVGIAVELGHGVTDEEFKKQIPRIRDTAMTTFASPGSFWTGTGQIYVGAHDGTLYAFGFNDERRATNEGS